MTQRLTRFTAVLMACTAAFAAQAQDDAVTIVLPEELDNVDPCMASQSNIGRVILQNVSETLTELDPDKGLVPRLADSWEDMGNGTWRFHLHPGVKFTDGSAFDAADVSDSLKRTKSEGLACEIGAKFFGGIELTTNAVDDLTVDITANPAQPILPLLLSTATMMPSGLPMDSYVETPVGTGPYVFAEYNRGENIKLAANPDYWGAAPTVKSATYVFRSDSAVAAAMVAAGEADIAPNIAVQDATDPSMDFSYPNSETVYIRLDTTMAPLDDIRVREALNYAVDREAFVGTILAPGTLMATGIAPPSTIGYNHDLVPWPYDPEKAKELLAAAKADGVPVDQEITVIGRTNNFGNVLETMEALTDMWKEVGFNVKLEMQDVAEWIKHYSKPFPEGRGPEMVEGMHDNANGDPVFSMFFKYDSEGQQSGITDPKLDDMIAKATAAVGDERTKDWSDTFKYIYDQAYDVMLWHMVGFSRVNPRLDFKPTIRTNSELQLSQIGFK